MFGYLISTSTQGIKPVPYRVMDQNNYDFIMNQTTPPKKIFGGGKHQRILLIIGGAVILLILILLVASIMGSRKDTAEKLAPVAAAQFDLIAITEKGAKEARDTQLQNKTTSANLIVSTQNTSTVARMGKNAKKLSAPYQNNGYEKELEDAKNTGSFDKVYSAILSNRLDLYRQSLVTAYSQTSDTKLKKELESFYSQVGVLIGEPTTPKQ